MEQKTIERFKKMVKPYKKTILIVGGSLGATVLVGVIVVIVVVTARRRAEHTRGDSA